MNGPKKMVPAFLPMGLSLLLALGSATVFSACGAKEDGSWMRCHSAQTTVTLCAAILSAALLLPVFLKQKAWRIILYGAGAIGGAAVFLIPGRLTPMCMMRTMRCYTLFQPFVRIMAALIACSCLIQVIRAARERRH